MCWPSCPVPLWPSPQLSPPKRHQGPAQATRETPRGHHAQSDPQLVQAIKPGKPPDSHRSGAAGRREKQNSSPTGRALRDMGRVGGEGERLRRCPPPRFGRCQRSAPAHAVCRSRKWLGRRRRGLRPRNRDPGGAGGQTPPRSPSRASRATATGQAPCPARGPATWFPGRGQHRVATGGGRRAFPRGSGHTSIIPKEGPAPGSPRGPCPCPCEDRALTARLLL